MTTYRVLEPEDWGFRFSKPPVKEILGDPELFIHHRAGNARHLIPAEQAFYQMNEAAIADTTDPKSAVDYDILVHEHTPSDTVTIGIARGQWRSAATLDRNEQGEAICALGYFHPGHSLSERPSPGMLEGIARACVVSIERGWNAPDAIILGHRQNPAHPGATSCPGDYLFEKLPWIRTRVAQLLNPTKPDPQPLPPPTPPEDEPVYFTRKPQPATLWQTIAPYVAVRVDTEAFVARGIDPKSIPVIDAAEAAKYEYLAALPASSAL